MAIRKIIVTLFSLLFFVTPLIFFNQTSELFEFNKLVFVYFISILISGFWIAESIQNGRFVFRRSPLDIPLIVFLTTQLLSTIFSIDPHTSWLGYYSRFNGGLISSISYAFLYWAYVSHNSKENTYSHIAYLLLSAFFVGIYATLEHFGKSISCLLITGNFDVACWVQDVALRVFATFGQPNWLASWIVALIPFTWISFYSTKTLTKKDGIEYYLSKYTFILIPLSVFFFSVLLFTKSRSGSIGFAISVLVFTLFAAIKLNKKLFVHFCIIFAITLITALTIGTPWTPSLFEKKIQITENSSPQIGTSLESGGTESGAIRKIVWSGAIAIWKNYPIFGSGIETFAFSYYQFRPANHNITSEWNYLYNKAHNEYLNILATAGLLGFLGYIFLICTSVFLIGSKIYKSYKRGKTNSEIDQSYFVYTSLLSGYISLLVTNFFGFSVVSTSLLLFLYPAMALTIFSSKTESKSKSKFNQLFLFVPLLIAVYFLNILYNYWTADIAYADALINLENNNTVSADRYIKNAIAHSSSEALYHDLQAQIYTQALFQLSEPSESVKKEFLQKIIAEIKNVESLAPYNIKLIKSASNIYSDLGEIDSTYLLHTIEKVNTLESLAPTDPGVFYTKGLTYAKLGNLEYAIEAMEHAIYLKPNYKKARELLALIYIEEKMQDKAIEQYEYILKNIAPDDTQIIKNLEKLKK